MVTVARYLRQNKHPLCLVRRVVIFVILLMAINSTGNTLVSELSNYVRELFLGCLCCLFTSTHTGCNKNVWHFVTLCKKLKKHSVESCCHSGVTNILFNRRTSTQNKIRTRKNRLIRRFPNPKRLMTTRSLYLGVSLTFYLFDDQRRKTQCRDLSFSYFGTLYSLC